MARDDRDDAAMALDITPLNDIGKRLLQPNQPKDVLLKLLKQAVGFLCVVDQSPPPATLAVMKSCTEALVLQGLMQHKDKDVRLLVATCLSEVMRIFAPDAPYDDDVLKDIFQLLVQTFQGLDDVSSPSFARRVSILETVAKVRSCVMMLDLECDDLILEMFHIFFRVASDSHPENVLLAMKNILALVLEESEVIAQPLLEVVFTNLLKDRKNVTSAGHNLAVEVIEKWKEAHKVEGTEVQRFLTSIMVEGSDSELHEDYHDLFYEIYCCAPEMLLGVVPNLMEELLMDKIDVRLKALQLMGRIFSLPGQNIPQEFRQLFSEFVKRFTDKDLEVRVAALECAKGVVLANPGPKATEILTALDGRLQDYDDKVRTNAVKVICDLANTDAKCVPMETIKHVADRLRDKKVPLRKDTLKKLTEVYRKFCRRATEGSLNPEDHFEWIPSKVLRCIFDKDCKDFRPQGIEVVLTEELFPPDLPVEDRVKHWVAVFATFDKNDEKALDRVLVQKQRLQQEMQAYLSLRQKIKEDDNPELQKKLLNTFKTISSAFLDSTKAEEHLQKLHQMKDNNIFKGLSTLLDPNTTFEQSRETCEDLLKRLTDKQHPQYEFMKVLSMKCSYLLFGKEHVKAALKEIHVQKAAGSSALIKASLALLVEVASVYPSLIEGGDKDLLELLKESDETIKEGVVHILSKAGGTIREQIADVVSSVDEALEKLCLEGSRKQAKYAVSAISTVTADSGLKTLSLLYGRLVDSLDDKAHLPTILQSLGCIAQLATPVFETREQDIVRYVVHNLLKQSSAHISDSWDTPSEECQIKIYGLKMLVKSFLPMRDSHSRLPAKLSRLLNVINKLLELGELSEEVQSSDIDKAHIRLAAAKGVLRLASRWDKEMQPDTWVSTILIAQDPNVHVRHQFIAKVHQYLKERSLPHKYASTFALCATDTAKAIVSEAKKYTGEFISSCRREARARQLSLSTQIEASALAVHPEYVLFYLVHVLAHHPMYPFADALTEAESYEPFQRQLHAYLRALLHQDGDTRGEAGKKDEVDNIPAILAIFAEIKRAEDAVDATKSENLYTISDIGIIMTKELGRKKMFSGVYPGEVPLPSALYKIPEGVEGAESKIDGSHMPPCLLDATGQLKLKFVVTRAGQPSSPRVPKRGRRSENGDSSEEEPGKENDDDHVQKRSRNAEAAPEVPAQVVKEVAPSKPQRGRKRSDGPSRAAVKNEQQQDVVPEKKKRGRPRKNPVVVVPPPDVSDAATISVENVPDDAEDAPSSKDVAISATKRLGSTKKLNAENDSANTNVKTPYMGRKAAQKQPGEMSTGRKPKKALETPVTASPAKRRAAEGPKQTPKAKSPKKAETDTPVQGARQSTTPASQKTGGLKAKNGQEAGEDLINCRIKVYWPLDKRYYKGRVQDYDPKTKKHRILYDDGDVEQLHMEEERWTMVKEESGRRKRATEAPPTPTSSQTNQRGKLKKRGQTVVQEVPKEDGVLGPEASRVSSPKTGKEATTDSGGGMQYSGGGTSEAKSGGEATSDVKRADGASSPVLSPRKAAVTTATHSADPFEFDDNDQPLVDKGGGLKQKSHKGTVGDTLKIKRKEPPSKTPLEAEVEKKLATDVAVTETGEEKMSESAATKSRLELGGEKSGAESALKYGGDASVAKTGAESDTAKSGVETVPAKSGGETGVVESGSEEAGPAKAGVETGAAKSAVSTTDVSTTDVVETVTETDAEMTAAETAGAKSDGQTDAAGSSSQEETVRVRCDDSAVQMGRCRVLPTGNSSSSKGRDVTL